MCGLLNDKRKGERLVSRLLSVGPIALSIDASDPVGQHLRRELGAVCTDRLGPQPQIELRFPSSLALSAARPSDPVSGAFLRHQDGLRGSTGVFDFDIRLGESGTWMIDLLRAYRGRRRLLHWMRCLPKSLQRLVNISYSDMYQLEASHIGFRVLRGLTQLELLDRGATYVHGSSILDERSGRVALLTGWGGSGKTSTSARLLGREGSTWTFLGDDLSVVDADGRVWFSPYPVHVYPYNVQGDARLSSILKKHRLHWVDDLHWRTWRRVFGSGGVVRRMAPVDLYPQVGSVAPIGTALFLQRIRGEQPRLQDIEIAEFVRRCRLILDYELHQALPIFVALAVVDDAKSRLNLLLEDYSLKVSRSLAAHLENASSVLEMQIPQNWGPEALAEYLDSTALASV